ncbi:hypothetical protein [Roseicella sp. DB1501]|uniref:hypothetical protein n=1 Tax=Roseicella sp. DB1501 TaxID=2730925 RepID=UPI001490BD84|nr:hypothetical protein [Roseicella sp. DB1501]NOG69820.1 hypothetical protein [Roseicella sp. DB1501]
MTDVETFPTFFTRQGFEQWGYAGMRREAELVITRFRRDNPDAEIVEIDYDMRRFLGKGIEVFGGVIITYRRPSK